MELVDTTVLILQWRHAAVHDWLLSAISTDRVAICEMVALEYLAGARNAADYTAIEESLRAYRWVHVEPPDWARALDVHRALSRVSPGYQRSVQAADLLIAAAAERAGLTLVHYDRDYDTIAEATGQPVRWVAPHGSLE